MNNQLKDILQRNIKIWCCNRSEWEKDNLAILPSGDFIDSKNRVHSKNTHVPYVEFQDAILVSELSEQKIKDKAIEIYRDLCPYHYRDGRCSFNNYKACIHTKCRNIKVFAEKLNEEI